MTGQDWGTTLNYFFSTIAQTFAALVAFVYVAAQQRISWLDSKITSLKSATIHSMGRSHDHDKWMVFKSATQIVHEGTTSTSTDAQDYARKLKTSIHEIQTVRKSIATNLIWGLAVALSSALVLAIVPIIREDSCTAIIALTFGSIATVAVGIIIGIATYNSLKVSLKEDI